MSGDEMTKLEGGDLHLAGTIETGVEVVGEPRTARSELVDMVAEATWNEAVNQLGAFPTNPLPLWITLATRILRVVAGGESDPQRIKRFALEGLKEYDGFGNSRRS